MTKKSPTGRIYKNAPIIEAALDLKFDPADAFDFDKLDVGCREKYTYEYPKVLKQLYNEVSLKCTGNPPLSSVVSHEGLRFTSADEKQVLQ